MRKYAPTELVSGTELEEYEIIDVLGKGAFGITYLARDKRLDIPLAIKEFYPSDIAARLADNHVVCRNKENQEGFDDARDRFILEARIAARFNHPNIVNILRYFSLNSTAYMVMRYEDGSDLESTLKTRSSPAFDQDELLEILIPVLCGLAELHASDCVHRDIKPSNIYLRNQGEPMLLDFGGAQQRGVSGLTDVSVITPRYAPIEQYLGRTATHLSDIYALGATLYRVITGKPPKRSIIRFNIVEQGGRDPYMSLAGRGIKGYQDRFLHLIDQMLAIHSQMRPQSIDAILGKCLSLKERLSPRSSNQRIHENVYLLADQRDAVEEFFVNLAILDSGNAEHTLNLMKTRSVDVHGAETTIEFEATNDTCESSSLSFRFEGPNAELALDDSSNQSVLWIGSELTNSSLSQLTRWANKAASLIHNNINFIVTVTDPALLGSASEVVAGALSRVLKPQQSPIVMSLDCSESSQVSCIVKTILYLREARLFERAEL